MSHPSDEELVDLALGEVVDAELSAHVAGCASCAASVEELRDTAALVSTTPLSYAAWQAPDDAVWDRVGAELDADDRAAPQEAATPEADQAAPVLAPAPVEDAEDRRPTRRPSGHPPASRSSRRRNLTWGSALVAASLVVGLLAGRAIWGGGDRAELSQVALTTLDTRQQEGEASVVQASDGLDLRVSTTQPLDAGNGYLEVWLLNADGKRMVSVGVLGPGDAGTFPISKTLLDQGYVIVDISKERFDDKPAHSGDSLLRGRLPA